MRACNSGTLVFLVVVSAINTAALNAIILADTNRDGIVDLRGDSDVAGKDTWTDQRGALFLANIADTNRRCSSRINDQTPDEELDKCHDASDNVQRNPKYLAQLRTAGNPELTASARGSVFVSGPHASSKVRLFHRRGDKWEYVDEDYAFAANDLRRGLLLGIDARDVRRPNEWDGRVMVHFNVTDNGDSASDRVALRVAPVLTHHTMQDPDQIFTVLSQDNEKSQQQFVASVEKYSERFNVPKLVVKLNSTDIWAQDSFEPGYMSIPGPNGPVYLRVMIRSSQRTRPFGRIVFTDLRSDAVGAVQHLGEGQSIDSLGNLETIPPYAHNGRNYPGGRAIMGNGIDNHEPLMMPFLRAQEAQAPVSLRHDWLAVGHTDEYMQFLPTDSHPRGWVMAVDDPMAGLDLLKKAQAEGHGKVRAMPRPHFPYDAEDCLPSDTIDDVLGLQDLETLNTYAAERIRQNVDIIKRETGIADDEVIRIPGLFYNRSGGAFNCKRKGASFDVSAEGEGSSKPKAMNIVEAARQGAAAAPLLKGRDEAQVQLLALYPAAINGLVFAGGEYLAPNPWGPVIDGEDIMAAAVSRAYARAGYRVSYIDDWFDHHLLQGGVHCGTNAARDASKRWWK